MELLRTLNAQRKITPELYIQRYNLFLEEKFDKNLYIGKSSFLKKILVSHQDF